MPTTRARDVTEQRPPEKPRTRIQRRKTAQIMEAALEVFSAEGFRGATVDQIAARAGMSKPNLLYYFPSKEAIHVALLEDLLDTWLAPLRALDPVGDPQEEILTYVQRKLEMSRDMPRESRLFANEMLHGAPHLSETIKGTLKALVDEKAAVIDRWATAGRIAPVRAHHLIFSVWALTQHYADFDVQVRAVLPESEAQDPFPNASQHLQQMFRRMLRPADTE